MNSDSAKAINFSRPAKTKGWMWVIYFYLYFIYIIIHTAYFFSTESHINIYYQYLMAFKPRFQFLYLWNALAIILNAFALIPFYYFVFRIHYLSAIFWQWLFIIRLIADITSRSYEVNLLQAVMHHEPRSALMILSIIVLLSGPSYVALYKYALECLENQGSV